MNSKRSKLCIFSIIFLLLAACCPGIFNVYAQDLANSCLSPFVNIDKLQLQQSFNYLSNQKAYQDYKQIFSSYSDESPRTVLKGDDLQAFLDALYAVRFIVDLFSKQGNAFAGLASDWEKDHLDDFMDFPEELDLVNRSRERGDLYDILDSIEEELARREYIQPDIAKTMHKDIIFKLKRKIEEAKALLSPSMPIDSINFNQQILKHLSPGIISRIIENISWENHNPDGYSGQRKIIISLDEPIVLDNGKIINSLEIKGVVYKINGKVQPPKEQIYKIMKVANIDRNNLTRLTNRVHLKGAMPLAAAKREYMVLKKLNDKNGQQYDYPVAYGTYKNYTFKGKKFGFVVTGVENSSRTRMGDWFFSNYHSVFELLSYDKARFAKYAADLFDQHEIFLKEYGKELRRFHDKRFYHGYPHMLNISWDKEYKNIVLNDFEASRFIGCLPVEKRVAYRLMDLSSVYVHFISFITGEDNLLKLVAFSEGMNLNNNPFRYFLEGYFGKDMPEYDYLQFISESIYPAVVESIDLTNEMDEAVVEKMFQNEGSDYERLQVSNYQEISIKESEIGLMLETAI